jgi:hypothetical protein
MGGKNSGLFAGNHLGKDRGLEKQKNGANLWTKFKNVSLNTRQ